MKKLISFVLVLVLLVMVAVTPAFAQTNEPEYLFKHLLPDPVFYNSYDEVYYHYVDNDIDWALVYYNPILANPMGIAILVGDRVIASGCLLMYFPVGWAIYDAQLNEIISIEKIDVTKYDGLEQALIDNKVGSPFGDADLDGELTILDSTYIQRALAGLCEFKEFDVINDWYINYDRPFNYISDIDADGERTVLDATAIQLKIAKK